MLWTEHGQDGTMTSEIIRRGRLTAYGNDRNMQIENIVLENTLGPSTL